MKTYRVHGRVDLSIVADSRDDANVIADRRFAETGLPLKVDHIRMEPVAPDRWKVGMLVEYVTDQEWSWCVGTMGVVNRVQTEYANTPGHVYQVFFVHPLHMRGPKTGEPDKQCTWWTTPKDVRYIGEYDPAIEEGEWR